MGSPTLFVGGRGDKSKTQNDENGQQFIHVFYGRTRALSFIKVTGNGMVPQHLRIQLKSHCEQLGGLIDINSFGNWYLDLILYRHLQKICIAGGKGPIEEIRLRQSCKR